MANKNLRLKSSKNNKNLSITYIIAGCLSMLMISCNVDDTKSSAQDTEETINPNVVRGCTDSSASNYNRFANQDDGSCKYGAKRIGGCMDPVALNFNPQATDNDNSCQYAKIPESDTNNNNMTANVVIGCTDSSASNYNRFANQDDGSCKYVEVVKEVRGCTDPIALNYNPNATDNDNSCKYKKEVTGCMDPSALNYNPNATLQDRSCEYKKEEVAIPIPIIKGCTDPLALNYNPSATENDNSCKYRPVADKIAGCMDPSASNYNSSATYSDGSCEYKTVIKTVKFKTANISKAGIEIIIKDEANKTLDILTTNSNGEAVFNLTDRNSLNIKYYHEIYDIKSDRNNFLKYANIMQDDVVNLHVMLKSSFS